MKNYFVLDGEKIPMSDETAKSLREQQTSDYQQKVIEWLTANKVFLSWKRVSNFQIKIASEHENSEMFIKAGIVQQFIKKYGCFGGNCHRNLYFQIYNGHSWNEVYNALLDIKFA